MEMGLEIVQKDRPGDPAFIVGPTAINQRVMTGPVAKSVIEEIQTVGLLRALIDNSTIRPPINITPGDDPPDMKWFHNGRELGLELTELTVENIRGDLSRTRRVARQVERIVNEHRAEYPHLNEAHVTICHHGKADTLPPTTNISELANRIAKALKVDQGFFNESIPGPDAGPGSITIGPMEGKYGDFAGLTVTADRFIPLRTSEEIPVAGTVQSTIFLNDTRKLVAKRVSEKDRPGNDILLLTAGLPDKSGYTCPLDKWHFALLMSYGMGGYLEIPQNLDLVAIHQWNSSDLLELYRRPGAVLPWQRPDNVKIAGQI